MTDAKIWNPTDTSVGGRPSIFLVRGFSPRSRYVAMGGGKAIVSAA